MARGNERNKVVTPAACLCSPASRQIQLCSLLSQYFSDTHTQPSQLATLQFSPEGLSAAAPTDHSRMITQAARRLWIVWNGMF
jgi:hypothetical protein